MSKRVAVIIETVSYTVDVPDGMTEDEFEEWWIEHGDVNDCVVEERTIDIREEGE